MKTIIRAAAVVLMAGALGGCIVPYDATYYSSPGYYSPGYVSPYYSSGYVSPYYSSGYSSGYYGYYPSSTVIIGGFRGSHYGWGHGGRHHRYR